MFYKMDQSIVELLDLIADNPELSPEQEKRLEEIEADIHKFAEVVLRQIRTEVQLGAVLRKEAQSLHAAAREHEAREARLKVRLLERLKVLGMDRITAGVYKTVVCESPPKLDVGAINYSSIDEKYVEKHVALSLKSVELIRDILAGTYEHPEIKVTQGKHLRISPA